MEIFTTIDDLSARLNERYHKGKNVGFVPTMGALHDGHLSLLRASKAENDWSVCSIYVNPTQFNNLNDLASYPRNPDKDKQLLKQAGCDFLFIPEDKVMYPNKTVINIEVGYFDKIMEGLNRPGHFKGVALVVSKLFNIVRPDRAYFGLKDLQQFVLIKKMVADLTYPIEIRGLSTVREEDGLAMSSRNVRLSPADRSKATVLYQALLLAKEKLHAGQSVKSTKLEVQNFCCAVDDLTLEYFEVADANTLETKAELSGNDVQIALCIAAWISGVRLIDNLITSV